MHENWLEERGEQFAPVSRSRRWIPSRDRKNAVDDQLQDATSVLDAFHIVKLAGDAPGEVCRPRPARHDRSLRAQGRPPLPRSAIFCAPHACRLTPRQKERLREAFVADEAHISVDVAYLHRASARGLPASRTHPRPTPGRTPHRAPTSLSHPRNRSPRGEPYATGRTHSTTTSTPTEQATAPRKPSTDIIELGRRTARGYRNPTNYQLRMLLIAGSLDASTHNSTLKSRVRPQFLMWSCFHDGLCCDESPQDWLSSLSLGKGRPLSVA